MLQYYNRTGRFACTGAIAGIDEPVASMSAGLARQKSVRSRRAPLTFSSVRAAARDLAVTAIDAKDLNNCETLPELHAAARDGQLEAVHALLANRADVNEVYSIPCEEHTSGCESRLASLIVAFTPQADDERLAVCA